VSRLLLLKILIVSLILQVKGRQVLRMEKNESQAENATKNNKMSQITLPGLLNIIDGIWSASTGERLIIFITNYAEKLDHALIRRGRMDMLIEFPYCSFDGFKMLAKEKCCSF